MPRCVIHCTPANSFLVCPGNFKLSPNNFVIFSQNGAHNDPSNGTHISAHISKTYIDNSALFRKRYPENNGISLYLKPIKVPQREFFKKQKQNLFALTRGSQPKILTPVLLCYLSEIVWKLFFLTLLYART